MGRVLAEAKLAGKRADVLADLPQQRGDGIYVVSFGHSGIRGGGHAFVEWQSRGCGDFTGLGDLPGGFFDSDALGMSAVGGVVVGDSNSTRGFEPMRWTASGGMIGLGNMPGSRSFDGAAFAVSSEGSVVVGRTQGDGARRASISLVGRDGNGRSGEAGWRGKRQHRIGRFHEWGGCRRAE